MTFLLQIANVSREALLGDGADRRGGNLKGYPTIFIFQPETLLLQVRIEFPLGLAVGVGNVISRDGSLPGKFTYSCHDDSRLVVNRTANIAFFIGYIQTLSG